MRGSLFDDTGKREKRIPPLRCGMEMKKKNWLIECVHSRPSR